MNNAGKTGPKAIILVAVGGVCVIGAVLGGFLMEGGPIRVLLQPAELLIIAGAGLGSLLIATPLKIMKGLINKLRGLVKGEGPSPQAYLELLGALFVVFRKAKKDGIMTLEQDVIEPEKSPIFSKYPTLLQNKQAMEFLCDSFRLLVDGAVQPRQLEEMMDAEIETHEEEHSRAPALLAKLGDSFPGLGIVAAVLGVVITMQAINGPPEEIGHKVAAALVGTFLGILMCYGFVGPLSSNLEAMQYDEGQFLKCIKAAVLSFAKGSAPIICIEYARRVIFSYDRPSKSEVEAVCKGTPEPTSITEASSSPSTPEPAPAVTSAEG